MDPDVVVGSSLVVGVPVVVVVEAVVVGPVVGAGDEVEVVVVVAVDEVEVAIGLGTGIGLGAPEPFRKQYQYSSLNEHFVEFWLVSFREGFHWRRSAAVTLKKLCAALQSLTPGNPYCKSRPSMRIWQSLSIPGAIGSTPGLRMGM